MGLPLACSSGNDNGSSVRLGGRGRVMLDRSFVRSYNRTRHAGAIIRQATLKLIQVDSVL